MARRKTLDLLVELAAQTDGVVGRSELLEAGVGRQSIARLVSSGLLTRVVDGVFVFGTRTLSQRQLFRAAVIHAGPGARLSEYSAAEQRAILRPRPGLAVVETPRPKMNRHVTPVVALEGAARGRILVRPSKSARAGIFDGLPVATMASTLIDVGRFHGARYATWAWKEADYRKLLDLDELRRELSFTHRPGARILHDLLATMPPPITAGEDIRSRAEIDFLALIAPLGIARPEVNVPMTIGGQHYVADFFWRQLRLVVEIDDPSHRRQVAIGRDRIRDVEFFIAELDVLRFETYRLTSEPQRCMEQLVAAIARQERRTRPSGLVVDAEC